MGLSLLSSPFFGYRLPHTHPCKSGGGKKGALVPCPLLIERAGSVTRNDNSSEMRCLWRGPEGSKHHARDPFLQLGKCCFHKPILSPLKTINGVIDGQSRSPTWPHTERFGWLPPLSLHSSFPKETLDTSFCCEGHTDR